MKRIVLLFISVFLCVAYFAYAQNYKTNTMIIKVRQDSIEYAINNGELSFLINPNLDGWTESMNVNGLDVGEQYLKFNYKMKTRISNLKRGNIIFLKNIKMKKPDGSYLIIGSRRIEII